MSCVLYLCPTLHRVESARALGDALKARSSSVGFTQDSRNISFGAKIDVFFPNEHVDIDTTHDCIGYGVCP